MVLSEIVWKSLGQKAKTILSKKGSLGLTQLLIIVFLIVLFLVFILSWKSKTGGLIG